MGRLGQTFLLFLGRGTGPKRSGVVLACFWTNFQAEPSILDAIRAILDDLGPNRHFGRVLDLQDHPRDWPGGTGPAHILFLPTNKENKHMFFCSSVFLSEGVRSQIGISGLARNADLRSDPLRK